MDLTGKLLSREQRLLFYGTTPPRLDSPTEIVERAAERLAERLLGRDVDAIVVYDIQDESGRTQVERPFPFTETVDPREFASLLRHLTGRPTITYKSLGNLDEIALARLAGRVSQRPWVSSAFDCRPPHLGSHLRVVAREGDSLGGRTSEPDNRGGCSDCRATYGKAE